MEVEKLDSLKGKEFMAGCFMKKIPGIKFWRKVPVVVLEYKDQSSCNTLSTLESLFDRYKNIKISASKEVYGSVISKGIVLSELTSVEGYPNIISHGKGAVMYLTERPGSNITKDIKMLVHPELFLKKYSFVTIKQIY